MSVLFFGFKYSCHVWYKCRVMNYKIVKSSEQHNVRQFLVLNKILSTNAAHGSFVKRYMQLVSVWNLSMESFQKFKRTLEMTNSLKELLKWRIICTANNRENVFSKNLFYSHEEGELSSCPATKNSYVHHQQPIYLKM